MKKHLLVLFTAIMVLSLSSGCRKKNMPTVTEPSRPLATIVPSMEVTAPTTRPTAPDTTSASTNPSESRETTEETVSETIEDGNGPIASQETAAKKK